MKRLLLVLLLSFFVQSCSHTNPLQERGVELSKYKNVFIDWLDFPEDEWQKLGYSSEKEWQAAIRHVNEHLQIYARKWWQESVGVPVSFASSRNDIPSSENDLYIKFTGVEVNKGRSLYTTVHFIDLKTNEKIFEIAGDEYRGGRFRSLENALYDGGQYLINDIIYYFEL